MESQQNLNSETKEEPQGLVSVQEAEGSAEMAREETGTLWRLSGAAQTIFYGLIILSVIGAVIAQVSTEMGRTYWLAMIPIIGVAAIYIEWAKVRSGEVKWTTLIRMQSFHWGSLLVAVELLSMLSHFGRITNEAAGSITLLLLAQATFLVGVHRDWRFCVVALFQILCLIVLTYLERYIWLMLVVAGAIVVLWAYFHRKYQLLPSSRHQGQ